MFIDTLMARLGLALAIGLLVGLERGWEERDEPDGSRTAGIRTYGITGLLGGLMAALADAFAAPSIMIAGFLGFTAVFAWYKAREASHDNDFSATAVIAALCVFALGALAVAGDYRAAAAGGAVLAGLLAARERLHGMLRRVSWVELRSALILAVMTAVVLPLLPDRTIDPWGGFNPRQIWFFTVLTAAISFLGYIAVKMLGPARGLLVSAIAGAVVSSTAVTIALARTAKSAGDSYALPGAASIAAAVSILRVGTLTAIIEPSVLPAMALPALAAVAVFGAFGVFSLARRGDTSEFALRNPFELAPLLAFAVLFGVFATANAALAGHVGDRGLVLGAAISGAFDVDVAVLGTLRLVGASASTTIAGQAILAALAVNAVVRLVLGAVAGTLRFGMLLALATALALLAGGTVFGLLAVA